MLGAACALVVSPAAADSAAELEARAEAAAMRGDGAAAAEGWRALAEEAREPQVRWRATLRLGEVERQRGSLGEAEATLRQALGLAEGLGPGAVAASRGALAGVQAARGEHAAAREALAAAASLAREVESPEVLAAVSNELANLEAAAGRAEAAWSVYAEAVAAAEAAGAASLAFRAATNAAALAARELSPERALGALHEARRRGDGLEPSHAHAYDRIRLAAAALDLAEREPDPAQDLRALARGELERARLTADRLGDPAARSFALGGLGRLAAQEGREDDALSLTRAALWDAQRAEIPEAQVRWHAQAGALLRRRGDLDAAVASYARAVDALDALRGSRPRDATSATAALPPVHLTLADLLLSRAAGAGASAEAQQDLRAAQATMERFKAAELRDHFRDDCVDAWREKLTDPARASATAAVVYPIALSDRLELLVSDATGIRRFAVPVGSDRVDAEARRMRQLLTKRTTRQYLVPARTLYDWLVRPLHAHLAALAVDTLVFVPGGSLRTIPMAALHDGEHFLVERWAVAVTPGLDLTDPGPVDRESLLLFAGGLSESREGFAALPHVRDEVAVLHDRLGGQLLLDESFVREGIGETLHAREFSVVHVATHAQFGATPDDSFLLTWDGRLALRELAEYVGAFRYRDKPLDLIMLSACETAAGDEQAALGLAGIAVRAGARSAIGTLWSVNDEASSQLVVAFYEELAKPGTSRARALQRAQKRLMAEPVFDHPAYWSPFLLISSWL